MQEYRYEIPGGFLRTIERRLINKFCDLAYFLRRLFRIRMRFTVDGQEHEYFYHPYNSTWETERAVELSLVRDFLTDHEGQRILEVGNVLRHYFDFDHDVVDKYEAGPGVIQEDITEFRWGKKYDLVVCVSTLEHIGWDECPREPEKTIRATRAMLDLLNPAGKALITVPLGYNKALEEMLSTGRIRFTRAWYFKRVSVFNKWVQTGRDGVERSEFGRPYPFANGLVVGIMTAGV